MAANDNIEPSAPAYASQPATLQQQHSSSTDNGYPDEKTASAPVDQYAVDPEKQSTRVGSLRADSDQSANKKPPNFMARHWKKFAQTLGFILFTVLVNRIRGSLGEKEPCAPD
jgi:CNT family concentrative nucleoside transporter